MGFFQTIIEDSRQPVRTADTGESGAKEAPNHVVAPAVGPSGNTFQAPGIQPAVDKTKPAGEDKTSDESKPEGRPSGQPSISATDPVSTSAFQSAATAPSPSIPKVSVTIRRRNIAEGPAGTAAVVDSNPAAAVSGPGGNGQSSVDSPAYERDTATGRRGVSARAPQSSGIRHQTIGTPPGTSDTSGSFETRKESPAGYAAVAPLSNSGHRDDYPGAIAAEASPSQDAERTKTRPADTELSVPGSDLSSNRVHQVTTEQSGTEAVANATTRIPTPWVAELRPSVSEQSALKAASHPRFRPPQVHIGQVNVIVQPDATPQRRSQPAISDDLSSRLFLRSL